VPFREIPFGARLDHRSDLQEIRADDWITASPAPPATHASAERSLVLIGATPGFIRAGTAGAPPAKPRPAAAWQLDPTALWLG
jgi:hypothetical protein